VLTDTYEIAALPTTATTVFAVQHNITVRREASSYPASLKAVDHHSVDGVDYPQPAQAVTSTSYTDMRTIQESQPDDGVSNFTMPIINASNWGAQRAA